MSAELVRLRDRYPTASRMTRYRMRKEPGFPMELTFSAPSITAWTSWKPTRNRAAADVSNLQTPARRRPKPRKPRNRFDHLSGAQFVRPGNGRGQSP